jgi:hypothetical protein
MVVVQRTTECSFGALLPHNSVLIGGELLFPIRFWLIFHIVHDNFLSTNKGFEYSKIFISPNEYGTLNRLDYGQKVTCNNGMIGSLYFLNSLSTIENNVVFLIVPVLL